MHSEADGHCRPVPVVEPPAVEYWEGARRHELIIQRCSECGYWVHPPRWGCPRCQSLRLEARQASGAGHVYAYSIMHLPVPGFEPPYAVAVIELAEQVGLITIGNILDFPPEKLRTGLPVRVDFQEIAEGVTLPQWRVIAE